MANLKENIIFDSDSKFTSDNLTTQQIPIPPRVDNYNLQRNQLSTYNQVPYYPNNYHNQYGIGNFGSNLYNPQFGNGFQSAKIDNIITESFSSINSAVQTFNAFNTLINTAYGAMYTSISTIAGISEQLHHTQANLLQIINSPKMEDLTSVINDIKNSFQWNATHSANNILSYLFFVTIICGPIIIYRFLKSINSTKSDSRSLWNSQLGKSYVGKVKSDFFPRNPDEMSVSQGEIVTIAPPEFQKVINWYLVGNMKGDQGLIPSSFVNVLGVLDKSKNQE